MNPPQILDSPRLHFSPVLMKELDDIMRLEATNQAFIEPDPLANQIKFIEDPDFGYFSVRIKGSRPIIGFVLLRGWHNPHQSLELKRIVIEKKGQGYGKEVLRHIQHFCFESIGFNRLWLDVFDDNERARHVYTSVGFKEEGRLRDAVLKDGKYKDLIVVSMLRKEFLG